MDDQQAAALRAPFPKELISQLNRGRGVVLDYVGHADTTDRILSVDPLWTWEPFALTPEGLPVMDYDAKKRPVGLWIKLTIAGVTRPGFGSATPNDYSKDGDLVKELIGDAIRNAAMRFGVAIDLWRKDGLSPQSETSPQPETPPDPLEGRKKMARAALDKLDSDGRAHMKTWMKANEHPRIAAMDADQLKAFEAEVMATAKKADEAESEAESEADNGAW